MGIIAVLLILSVGCFIFQAYLLFEMFRDNNNHKDE